MQRWRDVTIGDLLDGLRRYQPFLAMVVVIVLIAVVLPGRGGDGGENVAATGPTTPAEVQGTQVERDADTTVGTTGSSAAPTQGASGGDGEAATAGTGAFGGTSTESEEFVPSANCDPNTGRIKVPSVYAPPCPPAFEGTPPDSAGPGVDSEKIKIAVYVGELDPATGAILRAAGAEDDPDDVWATYNEYADYFETHYETYGREFELIRIDGGQPDDDVTAKANAQEVIDAGAFISLNGPTDTNVYMRELAANGIICVCTVSQPISTYLDNAPYVYATLMSSTQLYVHRAEYVGQRLWGGNAEHAGDALFQNQTRTFGLVYFDTAEGTYSEGADFFEDELAKYGASLTDRIAVTGAHVDTSGAQQEAPVVSQRLKDKGISSVIFAGDPLYPIFLTQEATQDLYFPEWIITGSVFSDTATFARLYDQQQWDNAFGLSALSARTEEELGEAFRVWEWHFGEEGPPTADGQYNGIIYPIFWIGATGIHMAGPDLTAETFRNGLFAYPKSGEGPVHIGSSFGQGLWPWDDYLRYDDMTEIWWDPTEPGENELGVQGTGLYRYVNQGTRYLAGQWPSSDPEVFCCEENTVLIYESREEIPDKWPQYPSPAEQQE